MKNELAFRDYNNRRVALEEQTSNDEDVEGELVPFVCECGNADCVGALMVTIGEYQDAHLTPNRFIVKTGHIYRDVEHVAEEHDHYWVVEKHPGELPGSIFGGQVWPAHVADEKRIAGKDSVGIRGFR